MHTSVLYMATVKELGEEIGKIIAAGYEVTCVTHLREMREPNMDGVVITDWLIIYRDR